MLKNKIKNAKHAKTGNGSDGEKRTHVVRGTHLNQLRWTNQSRVVSGYSQSTCRQRGFKPRRFLY